MSHNFNESIFCVDNRSERIHTEISRSRPRHAVVPGKCGRRIVEDPTMKPLFGRIVALATLATALGLLAPEARAGMQLSLTNGSYTETVSQGVPDPNAIYTPGKISYSNDDFNGNLDIEGLSAKSNSASNGPGVISQLGINSFSVTNLTGSEQILTISVSDIGFSPDNSIRPLMVFNSASGTFSQLTDGTLSFQTFAFDGTGYFQTTGPNAVSTDPVVLTPASAGSTTMTYFTPVNAAFSLTNVMTIDLAPYATIAGFSGVSLVHAPEPSTFAVALSAAPILAAGLFMRRRGAAA
jgi:hypothetical protein